MKNLFCVLMIALLGFAFTGSVQAATDSTPDSKELIEKKYDISYDVISLEIQQVQEVQQLHIYNLEIPPSKPRMHLETLEYKVFDKSVSNLYKYVDRNISNFNTVDTIPKVRVSENINSMNVLNTHFKYSSYIFKQKPINRLLDCMS